MTETARDNRRRSPRASMLKRAQIVAGEAVYDCVVLDGSAEGARVQLEMPVPLPDQVELRFRGGVAAPARQRWGKGAEWGLELLEEGRRLGPNQAERAWAAYEALRDGRLDQACRMLREDQYFEDEALRDIAEEAEAARHRLETALRRRAQRKD
jgi:hypothetical protein